MPAVEHDPATGLMAIHTQARLLLLDHDDLPIAGAALIRLAGDGHIITPGLVWAIVAPNNSELDTPA